MNQGWLRGRGLHLRFGAGLGAAARRWVSALDRAEGRRLSVSASPGGTLRWPVPGGLAALGARFLHWLRAGDTGMCPRPETRLERFADGCVHGIGVVAGAIACLPLALVAATSDRPLVAAAAGLYAFGLLAMLGCSAAYHLTPAGALKARLRRLDHAAIFLMIAGTYTPVALLALGGATGWTLFAFVWTAALLGAAMKLVAPLRLERLALIAYLLIAWVGVLLIGELRDSLTESELLLLAAGGLSYTAGVPVHLAEWLHCQKALWHAFVLGGAGAHYVMVLQLLGGA